jgi:hypothetical protein
MSGKRGGWRSEDDDVEDDVEGETTECGGGGSRGLY